MTKSLILRSDEVIENFIVKADGEHAQRFAYARAFGAVWATLTDEQRKEVIEFSEERKLKLNA